MIAQKKAFVNLKLATPIGRYQFQLTYLMIAQKKAFVNLKSCQ